MIEGGERKKKREREEGSQYCGIEPSTVKSDLMFFTAKEEVNRTAKVKLSERLRRHVQQKVRSEALGELRFLMRNSRKKNTVTHFIIMPLLPKVQNSVPTSQT